MVLLRTYLVYFTYKQYSIVLMTVYVSVSCSYKPRNDSYSTHEVRSFGRHYMQLQQHQDCTQDTYVLYLVAMSS